MHGGGRADGHVAGAIEFCTRKLGGEAKMEQPNFGCKTCDTVQVCVCRVVDVWRRDYLSRTRLFHVAAFAVGAELLLVWALVVVEALELY